MPSTIVPWDELVEQEDVLILDTETTGRGQRAEIIDIALIDTTGERSGFYRYADPRNLSPSTAMRVHKITDRMVADAKTWPDIHKAVRETVQTG